MAVIIGAASTVVSPQFPNGGIASVQFGFNPQDRGIFYCDITENGRGLEGPPMKINIIHNSWSKISVIFVKLFTNK